jgi:hypothetical protein
VTVAAFDLPGAPSRPPGNENRLLLVRPHRGDDESREVSTLVHEKTHHQWLLRAALRLSQLVPRAPYIAPETVTHFVRWLVRLPVGLPEPFIAIGDDGSIGAEWDVGDNNLYVTFDHDATEVYFASDEGDEWEATLDAADKVQSAMRAIVLAARG